MGCGLIKDLKTRYCADFEYQEQQCCGLIKDLKTRYFSNYMSFNNKVVV